MRKIVFRAKDRTGIMNHSWFYGSLDLTTNSGFPHILCEDRYGNVMHIDVDEKTIGQYTGLQDKNGKKIFEGDIVIYTNNQKGVYEIGKKMKGFIVFDEYNQCYISRNNFQKDMNWQYAENVEVIGNIYDNPKLIGEEV